MRVESTVEIVLRKSLCGSAGCDCAGRALPSSNYAGGDRAESSQFAKLVAQRANRVRCVRFVSVLLEFKIVQLPASMRRSNRSKVGHGATFKIRLGDPC